MKRFILFTGPQQTPDEKRLLRLASWIGLAPESVSISGRVPGELLPNRGSATRHCFAMSAEVLSKLHKASAESPELNNFLNNDCGEVLVFDCNDSTQHSSALSWLSAGTVRGVRVAPTKNGHFAISRRAQAIFRQLAGVTFSIDRIRSAASFESDNGATAAEVLLSVDEQPTFIRTHRGSTEVFLLAGSDVPDIEQMVPDHESLAQQYERYIPFLVLLRHCFGEHCWHGLRSTARIIIDDALLANRYGGLDYHVLRDSMLRKNFGTDIAFIPWNYWRTSKRTVARLMDGANLSVCVHGCDHTNKEFASMNAETLRFKAILALERLESQKKRTGVDFEPVMVFPQGRFSSTALAALRDSGYLAAVNSTCFPAGETVELTTGELLRPAVTRFYGFPIFKRHYPRHVIDFALDLFLGRPALIVEHHQYFTDGGARLEQFLSELEEVDRNLGWPTLGSQLIESCMIKTNAPGVAEAEFYTNKFRLQNTDSHLRYVLRKHEPDASAVQAVRIDGKTVPFSFANGYLETETSLDGGRSLTVEVVYRSKPANGHRGLGLAYNARVFLRRGLAEFRDTTLEKHPKLLRFAKDVARRMKATADS